MKIPSSRTKEREKIDSDKQSLQCYPFPHYNIQLREVGGPHPEVKTLLTEKNGQQ